MLADHCGRTRYRIGFEIRFAIIWGEARAKAKRLPRFQNLVEGTGEAQRDSNRRDALGRQLANPRTVN